MMKQLFALALLAAPAASHAFATHRSTKDTTS